MTKLPNDEIIARIEAALYSSGRPLTLDEIVAASGINSKEKVKKLINELINKTQVVFKALEIAKLEDGTFVFQLKPSYSPIVRRFSNKPQISNSVLKTLSYIAFEQPVTTKRLLEIRGSKYTITCENSKRRNLSTSKVLEELKFILLQVNLLPISELAI